MKRFFSWILGLCATTALLTVGVPACAAEYPSRTIQMVVPYAPGGTMNLTGRIVAKALGERLHQTVVVENKPGAAGSVGVAQVLGSTPDGYAMAVYVVSST